MLLPQWSLVSRRPAAIVILTAFSVTSFLFFFVVFRGLWDWESLGDRLRPAQAPAPAIPKTLWYKLGPKGLTDQSRAWTDSCIRNNTAYKTEFMTESSADAYVQNKFGASHPELAELYLGLSVPILKADLLRYLLLFAEGGVYCDLDVSCEAPIDDWILPQYKDRAAVVVGWEFDVGWGDNVLREFATWTIMARARSPHIWAVIDDTVQSLRRHMSEKGVDAGGLTMEMVGDVVDATGPRRFTRGILKSMEERFNATIQDIKNLVEPRLVGDVLVLPGYAFAASSNTYDEAMEVPPALVTHHYAGSWKNENGGEATTTA